MPEGDSVVRTASLLDRILADREVLATDFRVPRLAEVNLTGWTVRGTDTHGKHLFTRFEAPDSTATFTLHSHLGMDGAWHRVPLGRRPPGPSHHVRALVRTATGVAAGTQLKTLAALSPGAERDLLARLGPDLLAEGEPEVVLAACRAALSAQAQQRGGRPLAEALLDQSVLAGLGTVVVSEVCFLVGAAPLVPLADAPVERVATLARQILLASVRLGRRVTTGTDRRGSQYWVYGRGGRPCRRCGTSVESCEVGPTGRQRTVWWCPSCQPAPTR